MLDRTKPFGEVYASGPNPLHGALYQNGKHYNRDGLEVDETGTVIEKRVKAAPDPALEKLIADHTADEIVSMTMRVIDALQKRGKVVDHKVRMGDTDGAKRANALFILSNVEKD